MMMTHHGINSLSVTGGGNTVRIGDRDYPVVKIGNQLWMAENLDWKWDGLVVGQNHSAIEPRANYYRNDESTYGVDGNHYGLLYNWIAVNQLGNSVGLPSGWHVPTNTEFDDFVQSIGGASTAGTKLKSTTGWSDGANGTDDFGFSAFPAGNQDSGSFYSLGRRAYFWTASQYSQTTAWYQYLITNSSVTKSTNDKSIGYSVRLCKNL